MPRPRVRDDAGHGGHHEVHALIDEILEASDPDLSDPEDVLELVLSGGLTDGERATLAVRARDAIEAADWADHLDEVGAVVTSPASAREEMRARRGADRLAWQRVIEALAA